jgi:Tfp pilus assembly protein PilF
MSGYRWTSLLFLSQMLLLTGCQSSESGRFAWNPFRKTADKSSAEKGDSPLDLPRFAGRKSESQGESGKQAPIAEEQVDRLLADGQLALQEERFDDARVAYNEVLGSSPDNATAHHGLAMAADLTEQWADAEYHYRQALRIRPRDANLLCDIGYSYLLQNRYAEAARYLNHAIEVNPQHESAQMNLALLDLRQGNRQAAESRVISKFGSGPQAMQIMAQLESQTTAVTAAFKSDTSTAIPPNATLEQVQELARRERLEAERRRASHGMSQEMSGQSANPRSPQPLMPQVQNQPMSRNDVQVVSNRNGLPNGPMYDAATGLPISVPGARHAELAAEQTRSGQIANNTLSGGSLTETRSSGAALNPSNTDLRGGTTAGFSNSQGIPSSNIGGLGNDRTIPASGVSMMQEQMQSGLVNGSAANMSPSPQSWPGVSVPNGISASAPSNQSMSSSSVSAPQPSGPSPFPGRVIPIHSSGAFQAPQTGSVSYGEPMGFNTPAATVSNQASGSSVNGAAAPVAQNGSPSVYLDGLNVGPGAIFPVGAAAPPVQEGSQSVNSVAAASGLNLNNISSPGTNSMVNGAMYEQPGSALPSQDWANQQQEQLRAQQLQSQQWLERQSMGRQPVNAPAQNPASWGTGSYGANPGSWPASRPPAVNPLEAYEKQRQQLDSEYNRTLQQLDRQNPSAMPQF